MVSLRYSKIPLVVITFSIFDCLWYMNEELSSSIFSCWHLFHSWIFESTNNSEHSEKSQRRWLYFEDGPRREQPRYHGIHFGAESNSSLPLDAWRTRVWEADSSCSLNYLIIIGEFRSISGLSLSHSTSISCFLSAECDTKSQLLDRHTLEQPQEKISIGNCAARWES